MEGNKERKSIYQCKRTGNVYVRVTLYIPEHLWDEAREIAPKFFGIQRGAISFLVEEALKHWLALHYGGTSETNPRPDIRTYYNAVINEVSKNYNMLIPVSVPGHILLKSIMKALNVKERSANEWMFKFYADELIKPLSPTPIPHLRKPTDVKRVRVWEIVAKEA